MSRELNILIGIPGSGKSTWIANHTNSGEDVVVSRDEIRFSMVAEGEEYFSKEKEVFQCFVKRINEALKQGYNVFADATHINKASRNKLLRSIEVKPSSTAAVWIKTPLETTFDRNESRKNSRSYVPQSVIRRMASQFETPDFEEGFDEIFIVEPNKPIEIREKM